MSRLFGAGLANDAFIIAFRIPNLARDLFAEGALSSAFVPTFVEYLSKRTKEEAAHLANLVATAIILIVGALCLVGVLVSPWLVALVTGTWQSAQPDKYALAVLMTQIMFPFLLLVSLAAQAMGILNACNQYAVPASARRGSTLAAWRRAFRLGSGWVRGWGLSRSSGCRSGYWWAGCCNWSGRPPVCFDPGFVSGSPSTSLIRGCGTFSN